VPSDTTAGRRQQETRSFRTTRKELLALADWLRSWGVTKVGMESTGDYWKPVYFLLERQDLDCVLYHAAQVKALPGRPKTDPTAGTCGCCWPRAGCRSTGSRPVTSWNAGPCWRPTMTCGPSTPPGRSGSTRCRSTRAPRPA